MPRHANGRVGGIRVKYVLVEPLQAGSGVHAQLGRDRLPGPGVRLQRLGLAARAVQGAHEQPPEPFPQRMVGDQAAQFRRHLVLPPAAEIGLDPEFQRLDAGLLEPVCLRGDRRRGRHVRQRRAAPQVERHAEQARRRRGVTPRQCRPPVRHQLGEALGVQVTRRQHDLVAGRAGDQDVAADVADEASQPVDVDADQVLGLRRRTVAPEVGDEPPGGDRLAGTEQQCGQECPPFGRADQGPLLSVPDLERAQDPEHSLVARLNHALIVPQDLAAMLIFATATE